MHFENFKVSNSEDRVKISMLIAFIVTIIYLFASEALDFDGQIFLP